MEENLIALFSFEMRENGIGVSSERHYRLVRPDELTADDLTAYRMRTV